MNKTFQSFLILFAFLFSACTPVSGGGVPPAALAAQADLAARLGIQPEQALIDNIVPAEFSDSCLGLGGPAESCLQVITPGYIVTFQLKDIEYVYHTNADGSSLRAKEPRSGASAPEADVLFMWRREGGLAGVCDDLIITTDFIFTALDCGTEETFSGKLTQGQIDLLQTYSVQYAAFDVFYDDNLAADGFRFHVALHGSGTAEAGEEVYAGLGILADEIIGSARVVSEPDPQREEADIALRDYLIALYQGDYIWAAKLYGGSTEELEIMNPDIQDDLPKLLERGCTQSGLQCLAPLMVTYKGRGENDSYQFSVEFANADGSLFTQGPCCGETGPGPYPSNFIFTVVKTGDLWQVMELPPYMP